MNQQTKQCVCVCVGGGRKKFSHGTTYFTLFFVLFSLMGKELGSYFLRHENIHSFLIVWWL